MLGAIKHRTVNRGDCGSLLHAALSKLRQFRSPHIRLCLSEEILKAGGPFYLVCICKRKYNSHIGGNCGTCSGLTILEEESLKPVTIMVSMLTGGH